MNGVNTKVFQMGKRRGLYYTEKLVSMFDAWYCMCIIAHVHFIDYPVGRTLQPSGHFILRPTLGIGLLHVNNSPTITIYTHRLGKDTRRLAHPGLDGKRIETPFEIAFPADLPPVRGNGFHADCLQGFFAAGLSCSIQANHRLAATGCKKPEGGCVRRIGHLVKNILGRSQTAQKQQSHKQKWSYFHIRLLSVQVLFSACLAANGNARSASVLRYQVADALRKALFGHELLNA